MSVIDESGVILLQSNADYFLELIVSYIPNDQDQQLNVTCKPRRLRSYKLVGVRVDDFQPSVQYNDQKPVRPTRPI